MGSLLSRFRAAPAQERDAISDHFLFNGHAHALYPSEPRQTLPGAMSEDPPNGFESVIRAGHRRNSVIASAVTARALIMSQLRFKWRSETTGTLFGNGSLALLERPHPALSREQLLWHLEQDISYSGNGYVRRLPDGTLRRLRPDWVKILIGSDESPEDVAHGADAAPVGYLYQPRPNGPVLGLPLVDVAHIAPEPDPTAHFRGESWVTGVFREMLLDGQVTDHLKNYMENATTANMVITAPPMLNDPEQFAEWVDTMDASMSSTARQWRNLYVGSGTDVKVVGANLAELDLSNLSGGLETRVAARSRVHPVILGAREGLQGSSLNAGNYNSIRRLWADAWFNGYAPSWCSSLERIIARPVAAELTFDPARIPFLQEDLKDAADIFAARSAGMRQLVDGGFDPESVIAAAAADDISRLSHTGNLSVQLQPDGQVMGDTSNE